MQRWKHAGWGPKSALVVGILLGVASLVMYQTAYAAPPPYPGPPATPTISNGPTLGCNPTGTTNSTWVCGFDVLTGITFRVDGRAAGTSQADSNGCVLVVITFESHKVSINGNAFVPVHAGTNYVIVLGHRTKDGQRERVGLRLPFTVPNGTTIRCEVTPPTVPPPTTSTTTSGGSTGPPGTLPPRRPKGYPVVTTSTLYNPTTLAKALEVPLAQSPNAVLQEAALLAAVLAAVLSAGALGSIWTSGEGGAAGGAPSPVDDGPAGPAGEGPAGDAVPAPEAPAPAAPAPAGGVSASSTAATRPQSAFRRPAAPSAGGGGS